MGSQQLPLGDLHEVQEYWPAVHRLRRLALP